MGSNRILIIGGAGYVGSHFALSALNAGFHVTIMDNLSKGHRAALRCNEFFQADLCDRDSFQQHLSDNSYGGIFHFAASCLVGESVADPAQYYRNNFLAAFNMLESMRSTGHKRVVFSSSCAVYGVPQSLPLTEDHPKNPISPYGRTKLAMEWMLEDYQRAYGISSASLRYFNAAGCEPGFGLGEDHRPETHLIPNVVRYALGLDKEFTIYGDDYPTFDGACVRDYIHVTDLAHAHLRAFTLLEETPLLKLNLGTGSGYSNLQVVQTVARISGIDLSPTIGPKRAGDPPELVADSREAARVLDWHPTRSNLDEIVSEVLRWVSDHPGGYPE